MSPGVDKYEHFGLDLAITRGSKPGIYRVRARGRAAQWLSNQFSLSEDCEVIDSLATFIATSAWHERLTFLVAF